MLRRSSTRYALGALLCLTLSWSSASWSQTITEVANAAGDGAGHGLEDAYDAASDASGNIYVLGYSSRNVLRIDSPAGCTTSGTPCSVTEIMDATGDGIGNTLVSPESIAVDANGNVFVASTGTGGVFRIATPQSCSTSGTPCSIVQIMDSSGDRAGNSLTGPKGLAFDASGNVFVGGEASDNVFKIETPDSCSTSGTLCTITQIAWFHGSPGAGNQLRRVNDIVVDPAGNVYVASVATDAAFKIDTPGTCSTNGTLCTVTEILNSSGGGSGATLDFPAGMALDTAGNVYISGRYSDNVLRIDTPSTCGTGGTPCTAHLLMDASGDGAGNVLDGAYGLAMGANGSLYVAGEISDNAFRIDSPDTCSATGTPCVVTEIMDSSGDGDGVGAGLDLPLDVVLDPGDNLFAMGRRSDNVFRLAASAPPMNVPSMDLTGRLLLVLFLVAAPITLAWRKSQSS